MSFCLRCDNIIEVYADKKRSRSVLDKQICDSCLEAERLANYGEEFEGSGATPPRGVFRDMKGNRIDNLNECGISFICKSSTWCIFKSKKNGKCEFQSENYFCKNEAAQKDALQKMVGGENEKE